MHNKKRLSLNLGQKVALFLAICLGAWLFVPAATVGNALLEFCLAGVIPGTDIELAPNTIILGTVGLFALGGLVLGAKFLISVLREEPVENMAPPIDVVTPAQISLSKTLTTAYIPEQASPLDTEPVADTPDRISFFSWISQVIQHLYEAAARRSAHFPVVMAWLGRHTQTLRHTGQQLLHTLQVKMIALYPYLLEALRQGGLLLRSIYQLVGRLVNYTLKALKTVWYKVEPYLWRLDGWLEQQFNQAVATTARLTHSYEATPLLIEIGRQYSRTVKRFQPLSLWAYIKQQALKLKESIQPLFDRYRQP